MKRDLLSMVQSILSDMDSEDVNAISDSVEAQQVASVIEDTYYNLVADRTIPEHKELLKLTSLSDNTRPTHFRYPTNVKEIEKVYYNIATDGTFNYREVVWEDPMTFLGKATYTTDSAAVLDVNGGVTFYVRNDDFPITYTSFDDEHIVFNSYDATEETTLTEANTRAYGTVYPTFTISDTFEPDLDDTLRPYLLAEAKSVCFSLFKSGSDPKIEQSARRHKAYTQNDKYKTRRENSRPKYGRR